ncbi:uncharacterized protein BJ171DRAFT_510542 [Polychytrium aggregatum]|uniref:uncharacterized protein n=1 Tax=Polychytrium aggregatum TaxID=110093 RepID=UPI0022FE815D|nr:uncharacterized protein BJ171DRAFT_510542 [Polychytrium aggregatum]KAI9203380.1 hypothetical protein BJ171DRAFT_510542 [Polychytrium aggregatum]
MTWLSVGYVGYCGEYAIAQITVDSSTLGGFGGRYTFDRPLNVAAFALGGVDIILTGLPLNSVPVSVADKSNRAAVLFALGTIMLIPKEAKLVISVLFVIGSGITWLFIDPVEYQGAAGLSITVGYVKVILGAAVACALSRQLPRFQERIRRETFLLIRKKISIRKLKHQGLLNEIPLYFQGVYLNTGEPVFLFHGDVAKRPQTIAGWIWSNIWIVWHQAVDLRFKDAALERQFRL